MHDPVVSDPSSDDAQYGMRRRKRMFRWGIWFWMVVWCLSILVISSFTVNLKGWWGMQFHVGAGAVGVMFNTYSTGGSTVIRPEMLSFLWSEHVWDRFCRHPEDLVCLSGAVGWRGYGSYPSMSFPIAGFLWLWLIWAWMDDFRRFQWSDFWRNRSKLGRSAILVALPLVILISDQRGRRAQDRAQCQMNLRNIQQAVRGYSGMASLRSVDPFPWSEIFGSGKFLPPCYMQCPSGCNYKLKTHEPDAGVLVAECPNPDHQRWIKEDDISGW